MLRKAIFFLVMGTAAVMAQGDNAAGSGEEYGNDLLVVRSILDECGLKDVTAESVTRMENGRVIALDLSNKDVSKMGISVLPYRIADLTMLRELLAAENVIESLPPEIGKLGYLAVLNLASNDISVLPSTIGDLVSLERLDLRSNQLTSLPEEIGRLRKLAHIQLWGNKLTSLPDDIGRLPSLKELYLKDNQLTTLPLSLARSKSLTYIDFIMNRICEPTGELEVWIKAKDKRYRESQKCWAGR